MLFREGLRRLLDSEAGVTVCGDFATGDAAIAAVESGLNFDVALIDYELKEADGHATTGLAVVRRLRGLVPEARVLFVTAGMGIADLMTAVRALDAGIFLKTEPIAELLLAIQRTARGERWVSSGVALALLNDQKAQPAQTRSQHQALNEREGLVLRGVLEGLSSKEIGARLELSESGVKAVLQKLFEKTGVRSRSQLVRYAIEAQIAGGA